MCTARRIAFISFCLTLSAVMAEEKKSDSETPFKDTEKRMDSAMRFMTFGKRLDPAMKLSGFGKKMDPAMKFAGFGKRMDPAMKFAGFGKRMDAAMKFAGFGKRMDAAMKFAGFGKRRDRRSVMEEDGYLELIKRKILEDLEDNELVKRAYKRPYPRYIHFQRRYSIDPAYALLGLGK